MRLHNDSEHLKYNDLGIKIVKHKILFDFFHYF